MSGQRVQIITAGDVLNPTQLPAGVPVDIRTFGAKWDGVTDDTKAFEEAITASIAAGGVPVLLPPGEGVINGVPKIPKNLASQLVIRGAGMYDTTVKLTTATSFLKFAATEAGDTIGNVSLEELTVNANNVAPASEQPTVIGSNTGEHSNTNVKNVRVRRVRSINVPAQDEAKSGARNVAFSMVQAAPGEAMNVIENIRISECEFNGGQYGVYIVGGVASGGKPANIYLGHIYVGDVKHLVSEAPTQFGFTVHVQLGGFGWSDGKGMLVERIFGEFSSDSGIELDVPCAINDCWLRNANDAAFLFTTFNCATTKAPVVAKLSALIKTTEKILKVVSSAGFVAGERVVIGEGSEVRTIAAILSGTEIELTENVGIEHANGIWIQQVDDMSAVRWIGRNLNATRTVTLTGQCRGMQVQNSNNVRPCPELVVDGYRYLCTAEDAAQLSGEVLTVQTGTENSPSGNPYGVRIRNLRADRQNLNYSTASAGIYSAFYMIARGPSCPIEIQGEVNVSGPGTTGGKTLAGRLVLFERAMAQLDLDLVTKWTIGNSLKEGWRAIFLNSGASVGALFGRVRHRVRKSTITTSPTESSQNGVRFGKGCGYASQELSTKLSAEAAEKATKLTVESTTGFQVGQAIVVDALSSSKSEVFIIKEVNSATELTVVSYGETPGCVASHAIGAVIAPLRTIVLEDCDWSGLGPEAKPVGGEDEACMLRVIQRGCVSAIKDAPVELTVPASGNAMQLVKERVTGRSGTVAITGGTVSAVEWSPDGINWVLMGSATGVTFPVSPGDSVKLTWSVKPTAKFYPARV